MPKILEYATTSDEKWTLNGSNVHEKGGCHWTALYGSDVQSTAIFFVANEDFCAIRMQKNYTRREIKTIERRRQII
jgi:hypothetical protein